MQEKKSDRKLMQNVNTSKLYKIRLIDKRT